MHEFAIASSIKDIVLENISAHVDSSTCENTNSETISVELIKVQYGLLSQIVPEILHEAFNAVKLDSAYLQTAQLELECIMPLVECVACKKEYSITQKDELFLPCPHCNKVASNRLIKGKELLVAHIELQENV